MIRTQTSRRIEKQKEYVLKKIVKSTKRLSTYSFFMTADILNFKAVHSFNESSFQQESADSFKSGQIRNIRDITRKPTSANGGGVSCSLAINPMHSHFHVGVRALGVRHKELCASLSDVCHMLPDEIKYGGIWFVTPSFALTSLRRACDTSKE